MTTKKFINKLDKVVDLLMALAKADSPDDAHGSELMEIANKLNAKKLGIEAEYVWSRIKR